MSDDSIATANLKIQYVVIIAKNHVAITASPLRDHFMEETTG